MDATTQPVPVDGSAVPPGVATVLGVLRSSAVAVDTVVDLAASHGGEVRVWSVQNQGSTFTLSLPRTAPDSYPALPDPITPTSQGRQEAS